MFRNLFNKAVLFSASTVLVASAAHADMRITEWMYKGHTDPGSEFIEFTNVGTTPVDMTGWVYDDDSRVKTVFGGGFDLSVFASVAPGESVIITEDSAGDFRTRWGLDASVKIIGGYGNNLGRNDEINLYDNNQNLIDRLTYGDQTFSGSLRTDGSSGNFALADLGGNDPYNAVKSLNGDIYDSYIATNGDIGNPGLYTPFVVPEPASMALLAVGSLMLVRRRNRQ